MKLSRNLKIAGYDVTVGQLAGGREIGFVCDRDGERLYVLGTFTSMSH